jgi:hypothetical protein
VNCALDIQMTLLDTLANVSLPLFRLRGPFEELANVGLVFVVLQLLRMGMGTVGVGLVEFFCRAGPMKARERKKLASNMWYAAYYLCVAAWGLHLFYNVTLWAWDADHDVCSWQPVLASFATWRSLHVYHCTQVAFYLNYLFAMAIGIDVKRKDQLAFGAHHIITLLLIIFSRNWGYMRVQLAILVLHDAADPWLYLAKVVKLARPLWNVVPDLLMVLFALVFYVTRWFVYPLYPVASCRDNWLNDYGSDWTRASPAIALGWDTSQLIVAGFHVSYYGLAMLLLYALYGLHIYWGCFILKMIWKKLVQGEGKSDENSDAEEEEEKQQHDDKDVATRGRSKRKNQ